MPLNIIETKLYSYFCLQKFSLIELGNTNRIQKQNVE